MAVNKPHDRMPEDPAPAQRAELPESRAREGAAKRAEAGTVDSGEDHSGKSRSRKKRDSTALQKRGEELADLGPGAWKSLSLPEDLAAALADLQGMKTHEARRRQRQYIGRLMRELDEDALGELLGRLDDLQAGDRRNNAREHRLETLRDALLSASEGERQRAFADALQACPKLNRARLTHLVEAALADREKQRAPKHARELFRLLRETLE